ncbi:unnamed protein product (macronuclear) [Paramecium tetraurelia]|uniref:Transmembrane protein n=1 Tax=Paramecium tetraurelia TaxID=5888 RepID=A0DWA4_PARTE|nr:uncharacterized protein GSPATT00020963001 [Paramecium tetraurelia]CAK87321.1 unnamed protein product [Paramecium tetraurelia]|eukprot:XP_001454718.1 hypothetical protein (macronuclear) [Paramecium tetraurelia strain d4-2]
MIILSIIFAIAQSQQIKPYDFAVSLIQVQSSIHYDMRVNEDAILYTYPKGAIYKSNISTNNEIQLCSVQHDTITLTNNITKQIINSSTDKIDQQNDQIINAFYMNKNLGLVTEFNNYIVFCLDKLEIIKKYELSDFIKAKKEQFQEGIFSAELNMAFLFYQTTLIIQEEKGILVSQTITEMAIKKVLCSLGHIFIATKDGMLVYQIDVGNQMITLKSHIEQNHTINDIVLSAKNQYIFLLEEDGIHIYRILFDNEKQIQIKKYSILPFIPIESSFNFNQNNDSSFAVLKKSQKSVIFVDLEINLDQGVWFIVNSHVLKIAAQNLEINNNFVVIKGSETHCIIKHSQPSIFTNIFNYYPFTLAHTIYLNFYQFNVENSLDILYGVDSDSITLFQIDQIQGNIVCSTNDTGLIGQNFNYQIFSNLSDCEKKQQYSQEIQSKDLIVCQFNTEIGINIISDDINPFNRQLLIILIVCLGIALFLSILALICYGNKTRKQLSSYQQKIKLYQQFSGDQNDTIRTKQPPPTIDNKFKIDEFEQ